MTSEAAAHWDDVYATRDATTVSWFEPTPVASLRLVRQWAKSDLPVVDVGAGASALADSLLESGFRSVTVLDVSGEALSLVRDRLGEQVTYVVTDLLAWRPRQAFGCWHDRAVLHFLTGDEQRAEYVSVAATAVEPGGVAIIGTFASDGPSSCSGLTTRGSDADDLAALFADAFRLEHSEGEVHVTPTGANQQFTWVVLRRL